METVYHCGRLLWHRVERASGFFSRLKGLMGRRRLTPGEGLILSPCNQVHTFCMRWPIDVLYLTKDLRVLRVETLSPGRIGPRVKGARLVLEVEAGSAGDIGAGDRLTIVKDNRQRRSNG